MTREHTSLDATSARNASAPPALPPISSLLPHRGPMIFIDRVVHTDFAGNGTAAATISAGKAYLSPSGTLASHWLIELMAQAVGSIFTLQERGADDQGKPKIGYLVAIDDFRFFSGEPLSIGSILEIDVNLIHAFYPIGQYQASIRVNGVEVARSMMKFMTDDDRSLPFDAS